MTAGIGAQGGQPPPTPTETTATAIPGVIAAGTKIEVIKDGFHRHGGPDWPARRQPDLHRDTGESHHADRQGHRRDHDVPREHERLEWAGVGREGPSHLGADDARRGEGGRDLPEGRARATVTDNYDGKPYGRPNDLVVSRRPAASTSPSRARTPRRANPRPLRRCLRRCTLSRPAASRCRSPTGIERPNGIMLSPDEKTLYVNNTNGEHIVAFDVAADGTGRQPPQLREVRDGDQDADGARRTAAPTASPWTPRAASTAPPSAASRCSARKASTWAPSRSRCSRRTSPSPAADKKTLYMVGRGAAFKVRLLTAGYGGRGK